MKVAILGVGHFHSPIYVGGCLNLGHEVVLQESDPAIAQIKSGKHNLPVSPDVAGLLDREKPDFAVCMGSNDQLPSVIAACIDRRIPFFAEKPGARASAELRPLVERAEAANLFAASAFCMRWHPAWVHGTRLLPELGPIARIHLDYFAGPVSRYAEMFSPWMSDLNRTGGGCFLNLGVHAFDILRYWGYDDCSFAAKFLSRPWAQARYEDLGLVVLRHGETLIEVETGYCATSPKTAFQGEIFGKNGNLFLSEKHLRHLPVKGETLEIDYSKDPGTRQGGRAVMLEDLFLCLRENRPPRSTLRDLLETLRFTDWIYGG